MCSLKVIPLFLFLLACNQQKPSESTSTVIEVDIDSIIPEPGEVITSDQPDQQTQQDEPVQDKAVTDQKESTPAVKKKLSKEQQIMAAIFLNKGKKIKGPEAEGDLINDAIDHIHIEAKGSCDGNGCGKEVYLINLHADQKIQAAVETVWGAKKDRKKDLRQYVVAPHEELLLGCNYWCKEEEKIAFKRKIVAVLFVSPG